MDVCFEYVQKAYQFGFPTKAIHVDLLQTGYIPHDLSLDQFEEYFSNEYIFLTRHSYPKGADQIALRFIHYASKLTTKPHEIYRLGVARGFLNLISSEAIERCVICHKTTMAILQRGRNGNLTFDAANSNKSRSDRQWDDAVAEAHGLGYTAHEINYFSMKWYPDGSRGAPRGFASNYTRIVEIITTRTPLDLVCRTNLDWQTDQSAKEYVLAAFKIGIPVGEIVVQLHIHGHKIYEATEKLLVKFLREMDVL